jgi:hypothetical protein
MFDNYIIEVQSQAAGIVVREKRGFRFFAAHHTFDPLEGRLFKSPREAERAALHHAGPRRHLHGVAPGWKTWRQSAAA